MLQSLNSIPSAFISTDGERLNVRAYAFLFLLCIAFFVPGLVTLPTTDRDEASFAQATKQMLETNNYVDIHFQQETRYKKPIGIYWLQAAAVKLFNPNHLNEIWAYRLPSLAGATLAVLMTAGLGTLLFGPLVGFVAAVMMASCMILNVEARLAKTDAALLATIMVAQYGLARAYISYNRSNLSWGVIVSFWAALAAGVLIKGPIILLVLSATLCWIAFSEKHIRWMTALKPVFGIPLALLLIAPWFVSIMLVSHGAFLTQAAGHDLAGKFSTGEGRAFLPPGTHFLAFLVVFFPWSLWGYLAGPDTWRNRREPSVRFCLGWIIPTWIVFELTTTKLPHYVMPTYPAIAILCAKAMLEGLPTLGDGKTRWVAPLAISVWVVASTALVITTMVAPYIFDHAWNLGQIAASTLVSIAEITGLYLFFKRRETGVLVVAAGSLVFMVNLFANTLPNLHAPWISRQIVQTAQSVKPCSGPARISSTYNEPSLAFLAGSTTGLRGDGGDVAADMKKDPCIVGVVGDDQLEHFMQVFDGQAPQQDHSAQIVGNLGGYMLDHSKRKRLTFFINATN